LRVSPVYLLDSITLDSHYKHVISVTLLGVQITARGQRKA
jgi:hypothetical protein